MDRGQERSPGSSKNKEGEAGRRGRRAAKAIANQNKARQTNKPDTRQGQARVQLHGGKKEAGD